MTRWEYWRAAKSLDTYFVFENVKYEKEEKLLTREKLAILLRFVIMTAGFAVSMIFRISFLFIFIVTSLAAYGVRYVILPRNIDGYLTIKE